MSPERTDAYRRVTQTIDELGPSKLQPAEQERIRYAADSLIFCMDLTQDPPARSALEDIEELCSALVSSGRWEQVTAARLVDDLRECGPRLTTELQAA